MPWLFAILCRCRRRSYADVIRHRLLPESENRQKKTHVSHQKNHTLEKRKRISIAHIRCIC
jgi:hypothetical protein